MNTMDENNQPYTRAVHRYCRRVGHPLSRGSMMVNGCRECNRAKMTVFHESVKTRCLQFLITVGFIFFAYCLFFNKNCLFWC